MRNKCTVKQLQLMLIRISMQLLITNNNNDNNTVKFYELFFNCTCIHPECHGKQASLQTTTPIDIL